MLQSLFSSLRLKTQAWLVSVTLVLLTALLGAKAYSVARIHFQEMNELVQYEAQAQGAPRSEAAFSDRQRFRDEKLGRAHDSALGLLRLIIVALLICSSVTSWLLYLLFRGLLKPLATLTTASNRIGNGDLACRIPTHGELAELQELSIAFNSMAERLQKLDRAKTEFLALISHEIKNPLAALKEGLSLLHKQKEQLPPATRERALKACLIASKRLESIINNLLQHSRMAAGHAGISVYPYDMSLKDLTAVIQTAIEEVRLLADRKQIRFELSPGAQPLMASFHSDGMMQVFVNLLLNAIKYGAEQSVVQIETEIARQSTPPQLRIRITNSGSVIEEKECARIFDLFYRGSNRHHGTSGMGLGLHVVKTIVGAHRGDISARSLGGKTVFQVGLPLAGQGLN